MGNQKKWPQRQSLRLKNYDYSQPGWYFITICTFGRERRFGEFREGRLRLNPSGEAVKLLWQSLGQRYLNCNPDAFVVMPDHVHGLMQIVSRGFQDQEHVRINPVAKNPEHRLLVLGDILNGFKSLCALEINQIENSKGRKLWHRNYYERILQGAKQIQQVRHYIWSNPSQFLDANPQFKKA